MDYVALLKKENKDLKKLIEFERKEYDLWFQNYHRMFTEMWDVIVEVSRLLNLPNEKNGKMSICMSLNKNNPIINILKEMHKEFAEDNFNEDDYMEV